MVGDACFSWQVAAVKLHIVHGVLRDDLQHARDLNITSSLVSPWSRMHLPALHFTRSQWICPIFTATFAR
jgi:hypothetical protein